MATYVALGTFIEQGVRNAKDSPKRAGRIFKEMAKKCRATVKAPLLRARGQYGVVTILEAPDDLTVTATFIDASALSGTYPHADACGCFRPRI